MKMMSQIKAKLNSKSGAKVSQYNGYGYSGYSGYSGYTGYNGYSSYNSYGNSGYSGYSSYGNSGNQYGSYNPYNIDVYALEREIQSMSPYDFGNLLESLDAYGLDETLENYGMDPYGMDSLLNSMGIDPYNMNGNLNYLGFDQYNPYSQYNMNTVLNNAANFLGMNRAQAKAKQADYEHSEDVTQFCLWVSGHSNDEEMAAEGYYVTPLEDDQYFQYCNSTLQQDTYNFLDNYYIWKTYVDAPQNYTAYSDDSDDYSEYTQYNPYPTSFPGCPDNTTEEQYEGSLQYVLNNPDMVDDQYAPLLSAFEQIYDMLGLTYCDISGYYTANDFIQQNPDVWCSLVDCTQFSMNAQMSKKSRVQTEKFATIKSLAQLKNVFKKN